jgi:hypothetical protein
MVFSDDSAIGISSIPGIQTMTNCPGENGNDRSKTKVRMSDVSFFTRRSDTGTGR